MAGLAVPSAEYIAGVTGATEGKPVKVLDIAAGHGMFGITIARRNPAAQVVALDWPAVLAVAMENAKKFGVADRVTPKAGSAFETEYGDGYDFVLLTNILHHFDPPGCETIFRRVHDGAEAGRKSDRIGVCAQRGSRVAATRGDVQPDHAGEHGCGRCIYVCGARAHGEECRLREIDAAAGAGYAAAIGDFGEVARERRGGAGGG